MGRNRVVSPEPVRLPLSDGDWIDIKKRLNVGEQNAIMDRIVKTAVAGEKPTLNTKNVKLARVVEYLLAWSFVGANNVPLKYAPDLPEDVRIKTLNSLDVESFDEMFDAIQAHEAQMDEERAALKNAQAGEKASLPASLSAA